MSFSISTLLIRNLRDVFGENDPARRRATIDEIFTEDCVFFFRDCVNFAQVSASEKHSRTFPCERSGNGSADRATSFGRLKKWVFPIDGCVLPFHGIIDFSNRIGGRFPNLPDMQRNELQ